MLHRNRTTIRVVLLASVAAALLTAQSKKDGEWPTYAADLAGTHFRPLDQINAKNFSQLEIAWRFKTDNIGNRPEYKLEGTPLLDRGARRWRSIRRPANYCGSTVRRKARAARPLRGSFPDAVSAIGPTA